MDSRWAMAVIGIAYLVLATTYASLTPYRQAGVLATQTGPEGVPAVIQDIGAPDERQHANYVRRLMDGEGFPVLKPGSPDLYETYQSHQPPAYYVLAAGWSTLTGADPHDPASGLRLRLLNVFLGLATVFGVYFCGVWGLGRPEVALTAAAFAGLMPMFLALHGAVSNDPLLFALCSWTLALLGKWVRATETSWRLPAAIGVLAGLALLTKTTAVALAPAILVALAFAWRNTGWKARALIVLVPLALAAPWWMRNVVLYGDPFAIAAFHEAFAGSPKASTFIDGLGAFTYWTQWVGWWTMRSFVGVFGYMDIFMPAKLYAVVWMLLLGLVWAAVRTRRSSNASNTGFGWICATFGLVVLVLFIQFNLTYFQAQARYLYPAIAPIALGLGLGACGLMGRRSAWAWAAVVAALIGLNVFALTVLSAGFARSTI